MATVGLRNSSQAHLNSVYRSILRLESFEGVGVVENRRLREVLMARGFPIRLTESKRYRLVT